MIDDMGLLNRPLLLQAEHAAAAFRGGQAAQEGSVIERPSLQALLPAAGMVMVGAGRRFHDRRDDARAGPPVIEGVAVIRVAGFLIGGAAPPGLPGLCSLSDLRRQIAMAAHDATIRAVALEVDSYGGGSAGVFELAADIRDLRRRKQVWAIVADRACGGAYAIASAAGRVIVSRLAKIGSIDAVAFVPRPAPPGAGGGIEVRLLRAATMAAPDGDPDLAHWHDNLAGLRRLFASSVAAGRAPVLTAEAALAPGGATYQGRAAVRAGLADDVAAPAAAFRRLVEHVSAPARPAVSGLAR